MTPEVSGQKRLHCHQTALLWAVLVGLTACEAPSAGRQAGPVQRGQVLAPTSAELAGLVLRGGSPQASAEGAKGPTAGRSPGVAAAPPALSPDNAASAQPAATAHLSEKPLTRVRKALDGDAALSHPALSPELADTAASTLRTTSVPVLLPEDGAFLQQMFPVSHRDWYSLSSSYAGITVVVQGDRVATVDPEMVPAGWQAPSWRAPLVTRNEGIVEATFLAFGASYAVSVECAAPATDARCTEDAALLQLVQSLRRWPGPSGGAP